jgi:4-amino-4-deoxy-L-arabinose transferase-like glycosyltransferase
MVVQEREQLGLPAKPTTQVRRKRRRKARRSPAFSSLLRRLDPRWIDPAIVLALFVLALLIRWPYLIRLPHITDETVEIQWALAIARGEIFPLTASDRYYGPLHPYIVAGLHRLFGPSILLPRIIVMVFGALTVALTYLLGRALGGRVVGVIGAGLLATAPQHIIVNSHIAWQNSTTPFYAVLTFLALTRYLNALRGRQQSDGTAVLTDSPLAPSFRNGGFWLLVAGFCYGLTLHTHPGTIVLAPALALTFLAVVWRARAWSVFRSPWPWLTPVVGVIAYGPVLLYNITNNLAGVQRVQNRRSYAYEMNLTWEKYGQNVGDFWLQMARIISNPMRIPAERVHYLTSPFMLLMIVLCLTGIAVLAWRRQPLPLCALLCTALIMPAFNKAYGQTWDRYMLTGRYVTFLLPLAFIAAGIVIAAGIGWLWRLSRARGQQLTLGVAILGVAGSAVLLLVLYPLQPLFRYYTHESAKDPANASFLATVDFLRETREPRTPIIIGRMLYKVDLKDGSDAREIFDLLLDLEPMPHTSPQDTRAEIDRVVRQAAPGDTEALPLIIMMRDECWQMADRQPFQRVSERYRLRELYWTLPSYYAVYRYVPEGQPGNCMPASGPQDGE